MIPRISLRDAALIVLALSITIGAVGGTLTLPAPTAVVPSARQLTRDAATHLDPAFSPDGKYIVFSSNRSGSFDIWLMDTDGRWQVRLTSMRGDERFPAWSSDWKSVAFVWKHGTFSDLCMIQTATGNARCVTSGRHVENYAWSFDDRIMAYDDSVEGVIHLYDMLTGADSIFPFNVTVKEPAFGAGSDTLYFAAKTGKGFDIWSAYLDGSNSRQLSWFECDARPQVSPRGDRVLYLTNYFGTYEPWLVDIGGRGNTYLFDTPQIPGYAFPPSPPLALGAIPRWSPNGTRILMISSRQPARNLFVVTLDVLVRISPTGLNLGEYYMNVYNKISVGFSVLDVQWSPDGRSVVLVTDDRGSTQILLLRLGGTEIGYGL